ncbi:MAG: hypothetical protein WC334_10470 [Kiritimatiellales bacterium]
MSAKRIWLSAVGVLFVSAAVSGADVVFMETFENPLTGTDTDLATVAWHVNIGATAAVKDSCKVPGVGPALGMNDQIFFRLGVTGSPLLIWTEKASVGDISNVTNVSITVRNGSASEDLKIAFKINGSWYVSQAVLNSPTEDDSYTVGIAVQSVGWNKLTFVSGSILSEGGAAALPSSGAVQAVGIFDASTTTGKANRIDDFTVQSSSGPKIVG